MYHIRCGTGKPLLLIHGLGGHWQSWEPILDNLAATREVIAVDLPGFGRTPRLHGKRVGSGMRNIERSHSIQR